MNLRNYSFQYPHWTEELTDFLLIAIAVQTDPTAHHIVMCFGVVKDARGVEDMIDWIVSKDGLEQVELFKLSLRKCPFSGVFSGSQMR